MIATIVISVALLGGLGFGIYSLKDSDPIGAIIMFTLVAIITIVFSMQTTLFNPSGMYLSLESRQQFEDQIRDITSEEIVNVLNYDYTMQGELDIQIGTSLYVVYYETFEGIPTVKTIRYGNDIYYDRGNIEWEKEPNREDEEE